MKRKPYAIDDRQTPETPSRNPWKWIPTLYFAEALPYVTVMSISTVMYERMGLSNAEIAFYTSALYLPWVVKPLWSPFIDLAKSKRWWILAMEFLIAAAIAGVAFTLPSAHFLVFTLMFLWMMAFSSATHDIAADGFYMLALDPHEQSLYVGIRSTFYRIATIAGSGLLIMLAGTLETFTRRIAYSWSIAFYVLAAFFIAVTAYHFSTCRAPTATGHEKPCRPAACGKTFGSPSHRFSGNRSLWPPSFSCFSTACRKRCSSGFPTCS